MKRTDSHLGSDLNELYFDVLRGPHRSRGGELVLEVDDVLSQSLGVLVSSGDGDSDGFEVGEISLLGLEVVEDLDGLETKTRREGRVSRFVASSFLFSLSIKERTYPLSLSLSLLEIRLLGSESGVEIGDDSRLDGFGSLLLGLKSMQRSENVLPTVELILGVRITSSLLGFMELTVDLFRGQGERPEARRMKEHARID